MPVAGTKVYTSHHAFTVDFGNGPVAVQKCSEIRATRERMRVTIERGLTHCRVFADLYAADTSLEGIRYGAPRGLPVSVTQMNRSRQPVTTFNLREARAVEYSAGPWDSESSDFTMERLVIEYAGFDRVDTPESKAPNA